MCGGHGCGAHPPPISNVQGCTTITHRGPPCRRRSGTSARPTWRIAWREGRGPGRRRTKEHDRIISHVLYVLSDAPFEWYPSPHQHARTATKAYPLQGEAWCPGQPYKGAAGSQPTPQSIRCEHPKTAHLGAHGAGEQVQGPELLELLEGLKLLEAGNAVAGEVERFKGRETSRDQVRQAARDAVLGEHEGGELGQRREAL